MNSQQFAQLREKLGITQAELARIMGVRRDHIWRIESGERQPTKIQAAFLRYIHSSKKDSPP